MSVQVGPDRGIGIQIFAAFGIAQNGAPAFDYDDGLVFLPVAPLRERMPHKLLIGFCQVIHRVGRLELLGRKDRRTGNGSSDTIWFSLSAMTDGGVGRR